jgi:hypothetical protein
VEMWTTLRLKAYLKCDAYGTHECLPRYESCLRLGFFGYVVLPAWATRHRPHTHRDLVNSAGG